MNLVPSSAGRVTAFSLDQVWHIHCFLFRARWVFWVIWAEKRNKSCPSLIYSFYTSVKLHRPTGKILVAINCPNCLSRCQNSSTERPDRYLHSWSSIDHYTEFRHPNHRQFTSYPCFLSEDCIYPPFQLNDASLGASEVEKDSKKYL